MRSACRQCGFTLLELLLALAVGGVVLTGIVQVYLSHQQSHRHQEGLARLQENGRFALTLLARHLRMAGYDDPDTAGLSPPLPPLTGVDSPGGTLDGLTLAAAPDRVVSEYEGGSELRDCLGRPVAADTRVSNLFAVAADGDLICNAIQYDNADNVIASDTQAIAEGVEDLQLRYGEDTDGDGVANRYVSATDVGDWSAVVSVQATLLVNSVTGAAARSAANCLGCVRFTPAADRRLRGEFETTVALRNVL